MEYSFLPYLWEYQHLFQEKSCYKKITVTEAKHLNLIALLIIIALVIKAANSRSQKINNIHFLTLRYSVTSLPYYGNGITEIYHGNGITEISFQTEIHKVGFERNMEAVDRK